MLEEKCYDAMMVKQSPINNHPHHPPKMLPSQIQRIVNGNKYILKKTFIFSVWLINTFKNFPLLIAHILLNTYYWSKHWKIFWHNHKTMTVIKVHQFRKLGLHFILKLNIFRSSSVNINLLLWFIVTWSMSSDWLKVKRQWTELTFTVAPRRVCSRSPHGLYTLVYGWTIKLTEQVRKWCSRFLNGWWFLPQSLCIHFPSKLPFNSPWLFFFVWSKQYKDDKSVCALWLNICGLFKY